MGRDTAAWTRCAICFNFNPRAPYGARLRLPDTLKGASLFQSTRPVWGATIDKQKVGQFAAISIHAPRMGRDSKIVQNI